MKKKLALHDLQVQSFITSIGKSSSALVVGAGSGLCILSIDASNCGPCIPPSEGNCIALSINQCTNDQNKCIM